MNCNISELETAVNKLDQSTQTAKSSLAGEWDDEVKNSYQTYLSQCLQEMTKIKKAMTNVKSTLSRLASFDVNKMISDAEAICYKIDGVEV